MGLQLQKIGGTSERLAQARAAKMNAVSSGIGAGMNMLTAGVGGVEGVTENTKWSPQFPFLENPDTNDTLINT